MINIIHYAFQCFEGRFLAFSIKSFEYYSAACCIQFCFHVYISSCLYFKLSVCEYGVKQSLLLNSSRFERTTLDFNISFFDLKCRIFSFMHISHILSGLCFIHIHHYRSFSKSITLHFWRTSYHKPSYHFSVVDQYFRRYSNLSVWSVNY